MEAISHDLEAWKTQPFSDGEISFVHAVESLESDEPLIDVRPVGFGSRWMVITVTDFCLYIDADLWLSFRKSGI
jgi:hypothetical protein